MANAKTPTRRRQTLEGNITVTKDIGLDGAVLRQHEEIRGFGICVFWDSADNLWFWRAVAGIGEDAIEHAANPDFETSLSEARAFAAKECAARGLDWNRGDGETTGKRGRPPTGRTPNKVVQQQVRARRAAYMTVLANMVGVVAKDADGARILASLSAQDRKEIAAAVKAALGADALKSFDAAIASQVAT